MKKLFSTMFCTLLLAVAAAASPAVRYTWDLTDPALRQKNEQSSYVHHTWGDLGKFTDKGFHFIMGSKYGNLWLENINVADTSQIKTLELFYHGRGMLFNILVYGDKEGGYDSSRKLASAWSGNSRYYPKRKVLDQNKIPRWKEGNINRLLFLVANSGEGNDALLHAMTLRRGNDTLLNGSMILKDQNNTPLHWQAEQTAQMVNTDDFPYPVCQVSGGKLTTLLDSLVVNHRYETSIYAAGTQDISIRIYDRGDNVIMDVPLKAVSKSGKYDLFKCEYVVPYEAMRGELIVNGKTPYAVADALSEDFGGAVYWRAEWIWASSGTEEDQRCYFRKEFYVEDPEEIATAFLQASCDDAFAMEINNIRLCNNNNWGDPQIADAKKALRKGKNVITASAYNGTSVAGLLCELKLTDKAGNHTYIISDDSWLCRTDEPAEHWRRVDPPENTRTGWIPTVSIARPPLGSWGNMVRYLEEMPKQTNKKKIDKEAFAKRPKSVVKINNDLNFPRMELNGEIVTPMFYGVSWRGDRTNAYNYTQKSGFKVFRMRWEFSFESYRADGSIDYRPLEKAVEELLENIPDGKIMLEFRLSPPSWWIKKYPNEMIKFADGKILGADGVFASPASKIWREETAAKVKDFVTYIENSWFSSAIIAYMPSNLRGPEWVIPQKQNCFPDYSEPMQQYLREYLREKYQTNEALQKAWKNDQVTFETASVPEQKLRQPKQGYFLDNNRQDVMDYNRAVSRANVDTIMTILDAIHEAAPNKLRSIYFGYLMTLSHISANAPITGHYDLSRLLASGKIDVMASPITYSWRYPGDISGTGSVESSYRKHGILWLQEADNRTYLTPPDDHRVTAHAAASLNENWREFIYALLKREAVWFFEIGTGWYDNIYFHEDFKKMLAIYRDAVQKPDTYQAPVAYIFDEKNSDGVSLNDGRWGGMKPFTMAAEAQKMLALAGVPYDMFELEDVYDLDLSRYQVLYFQNAWRKNPRLAKFLHEKVYPAGKTVVWLYAPGFGQHGGLQGMEELTGMKFEQMPWGTPLCFTSKFGSVAGNPGMTHAEVFAALPPVDEVLGSYPENGYIAAASKKIGKGTSVWLSSYDLSGELMRDVLKTAGVKLLIDRADRVICDGEYLGVFVIDAPGARTVTVPKSNCTSVQEVITGEKIPVTDGQFTFDGKPGEIKLFRFE